jgi:membrane-bound lytic murein transglycosylase B
LTTPHLQLALIQLKSLNAQNWSSYYAMAVIELAEAVAREMPKRP